MAGHYKKAGIEAGRGAWEFRVDSVDEIELGAEFKVDLFEDGQHVVFWLFFQFLAKNGVNL